MGVKGSGMSAFVSLLAQKQCSSNLYAQTPPVLGSYEPSSDHCKATDKVSAYSFQYNPECTVFLIDIPGFGDTTTNDPQALEEISSWPTDSGSGSTQFDGIIVLHRVDEVRMRGWAKRNIPMFKKLCGPDALKNVILCTNMWDRVSLNIGTKFEEELVSTPEFWDWMKSQGSLVCRHDGDRASAVRLVETLVQKKSELALGVQPQIASVPEAKYAELMEKLEKQQKAHKELERLAGESRRREAELAAANSRLADELRDLRLLPSVLLPFYGLGASESADPPPYESL